jgi:hypothetical protein
MPPDPNSEAMFVRALGEAITTQWHAVGQDVQRLIFEAATKDHNPKFREELAVFLHDRHPRTS